jgi:hypothetical protein
MSAGEQQEKRWAIFGVLPSEGIAKTSELADKAGLRPNNVQKFSFLGAGRVSPPGGAGNPKVEGRKKAETRTALGLGFRPSLRPF